MTSDSSPRQIGRYRVVRALGAGGMGEVFLAEDDRLGRLVALKRPKGAVDASPDTIERLQREARHIAQLSHPGIGGVYDIVDQGGVPYIVMEYVEGVDLSDLAAKGPVPLDEALRIGTALAEALAAAHEQGIVHRDLKLSNVRITPEGRPKVLDFGLSRTDPVTIAADTPTVKSSLVTEIGHAVGSPGYAAPEQLLGQRVDPRTDVFSLGVVMYELCTGTLPFPGNDVLARSLATLSETPRPPSELRPGLPRALDELIGHALAKKPDARLGSATLFAAGLTAVRHALKSDVDVSTATAGRPTPSVPRPRRGVAALAGVAVLALAGVAWLVTTSRAPSAGSGPAGSGAGAPVVAVLTPTNLTGDQALDRLAVGFADSLVTDLSILRDVVVIPSAEIRQEAERAKGDRPALARSLGASYLADSSIQQAGDQLRVNARLLASGGEVVWAREFSGTVAGVFALQRQLAEGFVEGLKVKLAPGDRPRLGARTTASVEALSEYWRGRTLLEAGGLASTESAIAAFESAVAQDAGYAEAFAALGEAALVIYGLTKEPQWIDRAVKASETALGLAPTLPRVWLTLAAVHNDTGDPKRALDDLAKAAAQLPYSDDVYRLQGTVLQGLGRTEEALAADRRAIELRPNYWRNHQRLGIMLFRLGRLDESVASFTRVTELQPDNASGFQGLGTVQHSAGRVDQARANYERALALAPTATAYSNLGVILHWQGRYREAIAQYEKALALAPARAARSHVLRRNMGDAYARLGDTTRARQLYGVAASLAEQELAINNRSTKALGDLAIYRAKLGEVGQARQHVAAALALAPDDADVRYSEAVVEALTGQVGPAWTALRRALELGTSLVVVEHDEDLDGVRRLPEYSEWTNR